MTTWLPGARLVFTHGLVCRPFSRALRATQPGGDQHRRVGRVGAAGDRGDGDVAVAEVELLALDRHARVVVLLVGVLQLAVELVVDVAQQHPVLRPLGPGERRLDRAHVELERVGEHRLGARRVAPQALRLAIGLDQLDPVGVAAGQLEIVERALVDREEAAGRAIFGRHVGDGRAVGDASCCRGPARRIRRSGRRRPSGAASG